jgi:hypothetical protein
MRATAAARFGGSPLLVGLTATLAVAIVAAAPPALGQAWLPERGSLSYVLSYGDLFNEEHYLPSGDEVDVGHTRSRSLAAGVVYAFSDRLSFGASIPLVSAEYHGPRPHAGTDVDDSRYRTTLTDFRFDLRFQALADPVALAPYLALTVPSRSYETLGHAAPGSGLMRYEAGFFAGKSLDPWIARTYLQGRYGYTYLEPVAGVEHARSNVDLELGYFVTPRVAVRALGSWQDAHGGIEVPIPRSHPLFRYHDQLGAESFLNLGGGASISLTERVDAFVVYMTGVRGRNGHKVEDAFTLGASYRVACAFARLRATGGCASGRAARGG